MDPEGSPTWRLRVAKALKPNDLLKALSGAAVIWRWLPDDNSPASTIHHTYQREAWRDSTTIERAVLCGGFVLWLPTALVVVSLYTWRCGWRVKSQLRKGLLRQAAEQLVLAATLAVPSPWYYMFELYDDVKRKHASEYLYRFETKVALYRFLRKWLSSSETTSALSDKAVFAVRCQQHGVPAVRALATANDGKVMRLDGGDGGLPHRDLFFKPIHGAGGRGAARWMYNGDGTYSGRDGRIMSEADLAEDLVRLSHVEGYVVRAHVSNHPQIADLSPGALSTVRVVTCMNEDGRAEITHAVLRMARTAKVVVDNFHAGGIAAKVDISTGELGSATDMGLTGDAQWWDAHPQTGAQILGRIIPMWNEILEITARAHGAFADHFAIGWDVAVVRSGPELVEGNKSPDLDIIQRCYREPIGNSRFGELFVFHLGKALEEKYGAAARTARYLRPTPKSDAIGLTR